jgi:hypothetical protein
MHRECAAEVCEIAAEAVHLKDITFPYLGHRQMRRKKIEELEKHVSQGYCHPGGRFCYCHGRR